MSVRVDSDQCTGCGSCLSHCPLGLLELSSGDDVNARGVRHIVLNNPTACRECGSCELMCTAAALHISGARNGYDLIDREHIPPHSGCCLGSLAKALADAIAELDIVDDVVLFKKKASDVNLLVESYDYLDERFFEDGLRYKREHPEKLVVIICSSSKIHTVANNEERLRALADEQITFINTLNWFESDPGISTLTCGGSRILEELAERESGAPSFAARTSVRDAAGMKRLKDNLTTALTCQMRGLPYSVVEMVFPCFYRLAGRPQTLMPSERIAEINCWFDQHVLPDYSAEILKEVTG